MSHAMKQALILLSIALFLIPCGCGKNDNSREQLDKKPVPVRIAEVQRGDLSRYLELTGTVEPWRKANIVPNTSGRIEKIYKKLGESVKKNQLLAELDTTTLKLQKKQAKAALDVARANHREAGTNLERLRALYEKDAISKVQLERAQLAFDAAETRLKSAEATLDVIQHTLENSYMRAPFSGIVTSKQMEEGDMINPMMGMGASVLTLMDLSKVKIAVDVPEQDIERIEIGQPCRITVNSLQDRVFEGSVYSKNLAADPMSKTFSVEVAVPNPEIRIKAGVFARVAIRVFHRENILLLPVAALVKENQVVRYVDGKAEYVTVETGARNREMVEILSGVTEGDPVVISGNYDLKEGAPIQPEERQNEDR